MALMSLRSHYVHYDEDIAGYHLLRYNITSDILIEIISTLSRGAATILYVGGTNQNKFRGKSEGGPIHWRSPRF